MMKISTVFHVCLQRDRFCSKFVVNVIIFVTGCTLQLKKSLRTLSLGFLSGPSTKNIPLLHCNEMKWSPTECSTIDLLSSSAKIHFYVMYNL